MSLQSQREKIRSKYRLQLLGKGSGSPVLHDNTWHTARMRGVLQIGGHPRG